MIIDFYGTISNIVEADVSGSAKSVMVCLLNYQNRKTGLCFPSIATIAEGSGLSVTSAKRALNELKSAGLISWEAKSTKYSNAKTNHYNNLLIWSI